MTAPRCPLLLALLFTVAALAGDCAAKPARTDRYGDPLPPGARTRLGTLRLRGGYEVYALPERDAFLAVSLEGGKTVLYLWRLSTGEQLRRFEVPHRRAASALAPDGKTLALAIFDEERRTIRVRFRDVSTGKEVGELTGAGSVLALAFMPDGKALATAEESKGLRLWDWRSGRELRRFEGARTNCYHLAFSPDGKILSAANVQQRTVQLWDTASGRALHALGDGPGRRSLAAFSPDSKTVATADHADKSVHLWDTATGKEIRQFDAQLGVSSLAVSLGGKLLAAGCTPEPGQANSSTPIYLWEVSSGKEVRRLPGHVFTVTSLAFSADGKRLISGSSSSVARVWDVASGKEVSPFPEHESHVMSVAFAPDGRSLATGSLDGTIRLWETATGKQVRTLEDTTRPLVLHVAFSPDGRTLISDRPNGVLLAWDVATGRIARRIQVEGGLYPSASSPDGRFLAVWHRDASVRLLDAATGRELRRLSAGGSGAYLCFSPDGGLLAALSREPGGVLRVWDTASGREKHKWTVSQPGPILFTQDGRSLIEAAYYSPAGMTERTFHRWDIATGKDQPFEAEYKPRILSLAFTPDGRMLAWGDTAGTVTLWEIAAGQVRRRLQGHRSSVESLAFSPDGRTLASGSADTTALLWDVTGRSAAEEGEISADRVQTCWDDLANKDAGKAFDAIGLLTATPQHAIPMLKEKLHPAPAPIDPKQMARLLADLDSDEFALRQKAMTSLRQLDERAEPGLREVLKGKLSLEMRKRIEELLEGVRASAASPENLRSLRAVEVLEHIGTPEAEKVLRTLANGAAEARLTRGAKAARERLQRRRPPKP